MTEPHRHASHPAIAKRLKRAEGHLRSIGGMLEDGRPCAEIAQQLHAVQKAVEQAKRVLIQDHMDHCLSAPAPEPEALQAALDEMRALTKYL
ncbi:MULTISPECIES: metal-sensing transcriptional repressor [unclassified Dinoroseobacter]|uniref:metal-sensing transcriptional repressor n=1 Tax=unclassified Dinoroseobacter TaxID=2620028 RepID=UPI003C7DCB9F